MESSEYDDESEDDGYSEVDNCEELMSSQYEFNSTSHGKSQSITLARQLILNVVICVKKNSL